MTRKQFEKFRLTVEKEQFRGDCLDPISYGIQRALFEKRKFKRLIAAAAKVTGQTVQTKRQQWARQLQRAIMSQERFERLRRELHAPVVPATPAPPAQVKGDSIGAARSPRNNSKTLAPKPGRATADGLTSRP
jgi:hypothetical protein